MQNMHKNMCSLPKYAASECEINSKANC